MHHQGVLTLPEVGRISRCLGLILGRSLGLGAVIPRRIAPREQPIPAPGSPEPRGWHPRVPGGG